jgi:hypothetical protein
MRISKQLTRLMALMGVVLSLGMRAVFAQEGYPLDGTWRGEWGQPGQAGTLAVIVMNWDGTTINGRINPGRNTLQFTKANLDASHWQVYFEAMTKDGVPIVIEGKLANIGSYQRTITGTWTQAGVANPIVLTRE